MVPSRRWSSYSQHYRSQQMQIVAQWIAAGVSGAVVGLAGCGKSNFLGFLCHHPQALIPYLPELAGKIRPVPVDLNGLPGTDLATFYRVILRAFYEGRQQFEQEAQLLIQRLYDENRAATDPFLPQSALRELLFYFSSKEIRILLVLDRFDKFSVQITQEIADTLRSLRDSFKQTLSFIVGMRQEPKYLLNPELLGELYEILDLHICWVGPMNEVDARRVMAEELVTPVDSLEEFLVFHVYELTGGFPSLLKGTCQWYRSAPGTAPDRRLELLLARQSLQRRLREIWQGLSQAEQLALHHINAPKSKKGAFDEEAGANLERKGLLQKTEEGWRIRSALLQAYLERVPAEGRGRLWHDGARDVIFQGTKPLLDLSPLETSLLRFFLRHPEKRLTHTQIIDGAWPPEKVEEGVTDATLAQHIRSLRTKIEPDPSEPQYIVNWRGKPEGGYQFFPEGKPVD